MRTQVGFKHCFRNNLYIRVPFLYEFFDKLHDSIAILIWDEPHADLSFSTVWNGCFDSWSRIATNNAMHFKCWPRPQAAGDVGAVTLPHQFQFVGTFELRDIESRSEKIIHFALGQLSHVVIKAGYANLPFLHVIAFRNQFAELGYGIARSTTSDT